MPMSGRATEPSAVQSVPPPASMPSYPPSLAPAPGRGGGLDTRMLGLGGIALLAVIAVIVFLTLPRSGALVVTVSGPGDVAVDAVEVFVDDKLVCSSSPCRAEGLSAGVHIVKVEAQGYPKMAGRAVGIESGRDGVLELTLGAAGGGTGLRVPALGEFLRVQVDGEDRGALPVELTDLEPGMHTVRIAGNERYSPFEQKVEIRAGHMLDLKPGLKVLKGRARLVAGTGAQGARVLLHCVGQDRLLVQLPTSVDVDAQKPCKLTASRDGYNEFAQQLTFEEGEAEKTFTVSLIQAGGVAEADQAKGKSDTGEPAAAAGGTGTIRCNSIPASTVVVGGRPLGSTPTSTKVPAGTYTVMFVHPEKGRKAVTVSVKAGQTAVASANFR
jgi:hypothetical protein